MFTINYSIFILRIDRFFDFSTAIKYVHCLEHGESAADPHREEKSHGHTSGRNNNDKIIIKK
jgi:hypothetical protein